MNHTTETDTTPPRPELLLHQVATGERVPAELDADDLDSCCRHALDHNDEWRETAQDLGTIVVAFLAEADALHAWNEGPRTVLRTAAEKHRRRALSLLELSGAGAAVLVERQRRVLIDLKP